MKYIQKLIPLLDDILLLLGLISIVTASYMVNAILGTYILGVAFFVAAFFAGVALKSEGIQKFILKHERR